MRKFDCRNINTDALILMVRGIAAQYPTVKYTKCGPNNTCNYAPDRVNVHGCIMGFALRMLGIAPPAEGDSIAFALRKAFNMERDSDDANVLWLRQAQYRQDTGSSWAEAVASADEHAAFAKEQRKEVGM